MFQRLKQITSQFNFLYRVFFSMNTGWLFLFIFCINPRQQVQHKESPKTQIKHQQATEQVQHKGSPKTQIKHQQGTGHTGLFQFLVNKNGALMQHLSSEYLCLLLPLCHD